MRTSLLSLSLLASTAALAEEPAELSAPPAAYAATGSRGRFDRPALAEAQRQAWVDWMYADGEARYRQGRVLCAIGGGVVLFGAGISLGEALEDGRDTEGVRPGAILALAGAPFLLAGLPSMAAGTGRMRRALRMEGIVLPNAASIGAWSLLGAAVALPVSTLVLSVGPIELMLAGGALAGASYGLSMLQYRTNTQVEYPRLSVQPMIRRRGGGLSLTATW